MSMKSVLRSLRFDTRSKTKCAAYSLARPCREVPRITGAKIGRVKFCVSMINSSREIAKTYNQSARGRVLVIVDLADHVQICWHLLRRSKIWGAQTALSPLTPICSRTGARALLRFAKG